MILMGLLARGRGYDPAGVRGCKISTAQQSFLPDIELMSARSHTQVIQQDLCPSHRFGVIGVVRLNSKRTTKISSPRHRTLAISLHLTDFLLPNLLALSSRTFPETVPLTSRPPNHRQITMLHDSPSGS
jgi:hypothetical protein